ncbi:MAG: N-acetyltransferase [Ignavibacteriales bacterium CG_4_9_14_3_um_filter_30_11]|nr:MAG: N-acetyltransferase [Ignavibacteriales bacterium CG_4_9_14_3_um_filter_30_11]
MIRRIKQSDKIALEEMLNNISSFTSDEVNVAMELINVTLNFKEQKDYNIFVFTENEKILGYHCIGIRPLTDAVYDLYWIVVDNNEQGKGIGKKLMAHAEEFVTQNNGRWLLIETSSKDDYTNTRNFYINNNYKVVSQIDDFYKLNDSLIIYGKRF